MYVMKESVLSVPNVIVTLRGFKYSTPICSVILLPLWPTTLLALATLKSYWNWVV